MDKPKSMNQADWDRWVIEANQKLAITARCLKDNGIEQRVDGGCCDIVRIGICVWAEAKQFSDFDLCPATKGYLKGLGFRPCPNRNAYWWKPADYRIGKRARCGLDRLAEKYGYEQAGA